MQITSLLAGNVWGTIGGIAIAIGILLVMVTVHEFGHYIAGKLLGFKINEFSVGFGPALFKKRSKKTGEQFSLRIIPLGGYCAFDGEDYEEEENTANEPLFEEFPKEESIETNIEKPPSEKKAEETVYPEPKGAKFNDQAPWKRIIVLIAGATMNYILAVFITIIMFSVYGTIHSYVDYVGEEEVIISETAVSAGDIVLSVDGKNIYLSSDYTKALNGKKQGENVEVEVLRRNAEGDWSEKTLYITLHTDCNFSNMSDMETVYNAFGLDTKQYRISNVADKDVTDEGFFEVIGDSFVYTWKCAGLVLRSLGELLTGKISLFDKTMGGPGTTIAATAQQASMGLLPTLNIAAFIGVNLAVFNLLPIPALDGCKVIFCIIEWIRKKPVNRKVETMIHFIGIIFLFGFAILLDLLQWLL